MVKRIFDITASSLAILLLSPVMAVTAYFIHKKLGAPVLFRQIRPGLNGKPFEMIKFRSMKDVIDKNGKILPDSERLTSFGIKLRSTSLDELPELWNVLKGDMSLVGPRPLLMEYLPFYTKEEMKRHNVKPGVTGLAQISGRNALTWEDKFKFDLEYIKNQSFFYDIKIIILTLKKVFYKDSILLSSPQGPLHKYRAKNDTYY